MGHICCAPDTFCRPFSADGHSYAAGTSGENSALDTFCFACGRLYRNRTYDPWNAEENASGIGMVGRDRKNFQTSGECHYGENQKAYGKGFSGTGRAKSRKKRDCRNKSIRTGLQFL